MAKGKGGSMAVAWKGSKEKAKQGGGDWVELDPGNYPMQLVEATIDDYGGERKMMTRWCCVSDEKETRGKRAANFQSVSNEESLVWIQRELIALGQDVDELKVESEDDLLEVYKQLIEDRVCARVSIKENEGYLNMRVRKAIEVEESLLVDPKEALKGLVKEEADSGEGEDGGEEELEIDVGDTIEFTHKGKEQTGEVLEFNDDEWPVVKIGAKKVAVDPENITGKAEEEEEEEKKPAKSATKTTTTKADDRPEVGTEVSADFDGTSYAGKVTSKPPNTSKVQVTFEDGEILMMDVSDLEITEAAEAVDDEPEAVEDEFNAGDAVVVTLKGKQRDAEVEAYDGEHVTVKLAKAIDGKSRFKFKADKVQLKVTED
jgi:hypothetical protein